MPPEVVFPGTKGTENELIDLLASLSRDDALFHAARLNTLVTGPGDFDVKGRQQSALNILCTNQQIDQINAFIRSRGSAAGLVAIFFRGQILEFMRWAARHCTNYPGDGETFNDPVQRQKLLKALLISSVLWGKRVFGGRLTGTEEHRRRAPTGPGRFPQGSGGE